MADVHTKEQRSFNMSRIRAKNTKPEMVVRSMVHRMGFRYRLHRKDLPGKPDLVFSRCKKVIFVHGCFWHKHKCKYGRVKPKTNEEFWGKKRSGNAERDKKNRKALRDDGWRILEIWECEIKSNNLQDLGQKIKSFIEKE